MRKKDSHKHKRSEKNKFQERNKQMRRKESNILNSVNQQTHKKNRGERKKQTVLKSTKKKRPAELQESANTSQ
jgi:hypothetical protein